MVLEFYFSSLFIVIYAGDLYDTEYHKDYL